MMHELTARIAALSDEQRGLLGELLSRLVTVPTREGKLVAYVVPDAGRAPDPSELRAFLAASLPEHMVPAAVVIMDALPRLANGKLDVNALPDPGIGDDRIAGRVVPPRSPVEHALADVWAAVLGSERIGVEDNFFEIGGDSILSIQVVAHARKVGLVLTPDQLFRHQTIAELAQVIGMAQPTAPDQAPVLGEVPLTPIQRWFFEQPLPEPQHWHQAAWLELPSGLDDRNLAEILGGVVRHHDALRLRFTRAGEWRQFHAPANMAVPFTTVDLSGNEEGEREARLDRAPYELSASTDLTEAPIRAARFILGPDCPHRLLITIHHLVVDPISWGIVLENLETALNQLGRGERLALPPKTTSFREWARALVAHGASESLHRELEHWRAIPPSVPRLTVDCSGAFSEGSAGEVCLFLDSHETYSLHHDCSAAYNTTPEELLLTGLVQALGSWQGEPRLLIGLERHGREPVVEGIDLSRTIGWFTSFFPVLLDLTGANEPGAALTAIKEQLRRVPARGIGYGVLRYLSPDPEIREQLRQIPQPQVVFNYTRLSLDKPGAAGTLRLLGGPTASRGSANARGHLLEINAHPDGDRLKLQWSYGRDVFRASTVERVAREHLSAVRALMAHCVSPQSGAYTPSDFPDAGLTQEELDRLLRRL